MTLVPHDSFFDCDGKQHNDTISRNTVVDARGARRNQARDILRDGVIFDSSVLLQFKGTLYEGIAASVVTILSDSVTFMDVLFLGDSKEKCIGVSLGPILTPIPQMVTPDEALPARANIRIPIIISQFYGLIHPTVTVSQVGRLGRPQMGSKTFLSKSDCVCKVHKATVCEDPLRALPRDDNVERLSKPRARIMVEKVTSSRSRVGEIYGIKRGILWRGLLEHEWFKCGLETQQRCKRDVH